jgi:hypothetical protein
MRTVFEALGSGEQNLGGGGGVEGGRDLPTQDAAREVVDHCVQIGSAAVEQPDHGGVDVPELIGTRGSNSN